MKITLRLGLSASGFVVLAGVLLAQNGTVPNPFQPAERNWGKFPDGHPWGSTAGIELGPKGEVWAIDRCGANSCEGSDIAPIVLLDLATGMPKKAIGAGLFVFPHGLDVDADGNIWVSDALASKDGKKGQQVVKLSPDGKVLMTLGTAGVAGGGPNHFNEPSDVLVVPNGDIFVVDGHSGQMPTVPPDYVTRVVKFDKNGKFVKEWGKLGSGPGEFHNPHALAVDSRGRIFVADRGNARMQIFDQNGKFLEEWKQFGRPSGMYIDANDRIYVMDADSTTANHPGWKKGIWIGSAKDGSVSGYVPGHTEGGPDGAAGEGVIVAPDGNLYAAENTLKGITRYRKKAEPVYVGHQRANELMARSSEILHVDDVIVKGHHIDHPLSLQSASNTVMYIVDGAATVAVSGVTGGPFDVAKGDAFLFPQGAFAHFQKISAPVTAYAVAVSKELSATPATFAFVKADKIAPTLKKAGPIADAPNFRFSGGFRTGPYAPADYRPDVEVHENSADLFIVVDGTATQVLGGTVVGGHSTGPGEIRGQKIEGGETFKISKGDVMWVPKNTPHWFPEIPTPLSYLLVKIQY